MMVKCLFRGCFQNVLSATVSVKPPATNTPKPSKKKVLACECQGSRSIMFLMTHGFEFNEELRAPLFRDLGDKNVMLMRNHGCLICSPSVGQAFVLHHFLELACQGQLAAMTGGAEINIPDEEVLDFAVSQLGKIPTEKALAKDWPACLRMAERVAPGFDN